MVEDIKEKLLELLQQKAAEGSELNEGLIRQLIDEAIKNQDDEKKENLEGVLQVACKERCVSRNKCLLVRLVRRKGCLCSVERL